MMSNRLRVGVVGLGWAATSIWLPRLARHDRFEVVVGMDPSPEARNRASLLVEGISLVADVDDILLSYLDLVFVLSPNADHAAQVRWFLERGIDVFVEKPPCLTEYELQLLQTAAEVSGARLNVSDASLYRTDVRRMISLLSQSDPILSVEASWTRSGGLPRSSWFVDKARSGGGSAVDLGWHLLPIVFNLLNGGELKSATGLRVAEQSAPGGPEFAAWHGQDPATPSIMDVETIAFGLMQIGRSAVTLKTAWTGHQPLDMTMFEIRTPTCTVILRTTLGFSPFRTTPELIVQRGRDTQAVALLDQPIGVEYDVLLDNLAERIGDPNRSKAAWTNLRSIVQAIAAIEAVPLV